MERLEAVRPKRLVARIEERPAAIELDEMEQEVDLHAALMADELAQAAGQDLG